MPEGPEVEVVRQGLLNVQGKTVHSLVTATHKKYNKTNIENLIGTKVSDIQRRGKFLVWKFMKGNESTFYALNHLGMTGVWRIFNIQDWADQVPVFNEKAIQEVFKHFKLVFQFDDMVLLFIDVRTFGRFEIYSDEQVFLHPSISDLGPDVLSTNFDVDDFIQRVRGKTNKPRSKEIGKLLLDYHVVSGCGNIYKSEALFLAKIHPLQKASEIADTELRILASSLVKVATLAFENRGSSLKDYNTVEGYQGMMQNKFQVYGRDGETCKVCNFVIKKVKQGDRTSYYCEKCQVL